MRPAVGGHERTTSGRELSAIRHDRHRHVPDRSSHPHGCRPSPASVRWEYWFAPTAMSLSRVALSPTTGREVPSRCPLPRGVAFPCCSYDSADSKDSGSRKLCPINRLLMAFRHLFGRVPAFVWGNSGICLGESRQSFGSFPAFIRGCFQKASRRWEKTGKGRRKLPVRP